MIRGQNLFQLNHRNRTAILRVFVLWFGRIRANIRRLCRKHIFVTAFTLITVNSRFFIAQALCKPIPTVFPWITADHIVSTHVIDPLFEELTFLVTSCVEIIKLLQRQVVNCPVWDCTRTTIIMGRCQVCMRRTVTLLVDTVQLLAAFTETHTTTCQSPLHTRHHIGGNLAGLGI